MSQVSPRYPRRQSSITRGAVALSTTPRAPSCAALSQMFSSSAAVSTTTAGRSPGFKRLSRLNHRLHRASGRGSERRAAPVDCIPAFCNRGACCEDLEFHSARRSCSSPASISGWSSTRTRFIGMAGQTVARGTVMRSSLPACFDEVSVSSPCSAATRSRSVTGPWSMRSSHSRS